MKFKDAIEEVRSRVDIAEIVGMHVPLKRAGRNLKGLCPFHSEKTPSFQVSPEKQFFHCFGCGVGGSVFDFVMKVRNYSFTEALEYLAGRAGVIIETEEATDRTVAEAQAREKQELFAINEEAMRFFMANLRDPILGEEARRYLIGRDITDRWIEHFKLGVALDGWDTLAKHLMKKGVLLKQAVQLGLVAPREATPHQPLDCYDKFRARIIFPIHDIKGRVIGFGGRTYLPNVKNQDGSEPAKYINSAASSLFDKSRTFYLLDQAEPHLRKNRQAVVVEGYMDAIAMHRAGIGEVVATLGTALTPLHGKVLTRYVDRVVTLFDGDAAGQRAALRTLAPMAQNGLDSVLVELPAEHDPDSFVKAFGGEALRQKMLSGKSLLEFCCRAAMQGGGSSRETAAQLEEIARTLKQVPNRFQRELWLQEFGRLTGFSEAAVTQLRSPETTRNQSELKAILGKTPSDAETAAAAAKAPVPGEEEMLVCLAFESEAVYEMLRSYEGPGLVQHPLLRDLLREQFALGRKSAGDFAQVLEGILEQSLKQRLQACIFEMENLDNESQLHAARDCIRKILKRNFAARMHELSERIRVAEQAQNQEAVSSLLREKSHLMQHSKEKANV